MTTWNKYSRRITDVIAHAYDGAYHCPGCAVARFGEADNSPGGLYPWVPEDAQDSDGNLVMPLFAGDDWFHADDDSVQHLVCDTCIGVIDTYGEE